MSLKRYIIDGYGQIELNNVAFRRDGRVEAQCKLDATDFETIPAENGMLLAVDDKAKTVKLATDDDEFIIALNYTSEHNYNQFTPGLKDFKLDRGTFLPRLGYLAIGDKFTTNTLCYDSEEFADEDALATALEGTGTIYGGACEIGAIKLSATKPSYGPVLKVTKVTTMPDGQFGLKFQVYGE